MGLKKTYHCLIITFSLGISAAIMADDLGPMLSECVGTGCPANSPQPRGCFSGGAAGFNDYAFDEAYAMFIGTDLTADTGAAEFEGRILVLDDLVNQDADAQSIGSAGAGSCIVPPNSPDNTEASDWVTVGDDVSASSAFNVGTGGGVTFTSNFRYGGMLTGTIGNALGSTINSALVNGATYDAMMRAVQGRSSCWNGLQGAEPGQPFNGASVTLTPGFITLTGPGALTTPDTFVFNLDQNLGGAATTLAINDFPAGSSILINVRGATRTIEYNNVTVDGVTDMTFTNPNPVSDLLLSTLWNFPDATAITLDGGAQFAGSVLVPRSDATVTLDTSTNGRMVVAGSVVQGGGSNSGLEHHNYPFNGDLPACDFGDLPDTSLTDYPTLAQRVAGDSAASHGIVSGLYLGSCVDAESNGQPSTDADADDLASSNSNPGVVEGTCSMGIDEDGVVTMGNFDAGTGMLDLTYAVNAGGACLIGFADWNSDIDFEDTVNSADEVLFSLELTASGSQQIPITTSYAGAVPGGETIYTRFRLFAKDDPIFNGLSLTNGCPDLTNTTAQLATLSTGAASQGEVEDYVWSDDLVPVELQQFSIQ